MVEALAQPLAEAPPAEPLALRQVERAVGETLEHHAHVQLRAAAETASPPTALISAPGAIGSAL